MVGDDSVRHCALCEKNVYDLSGLTAVEAVHLLVAKEGNACVRLHRRRDGTLITGDCQVGRRRRRKRWLHGAAASLAFGGAAAIASAHGDTGSQDVRARQWRGRSRPTSTSTKRPSWEDRGSRIGGSGESRARTRSREELDGSRRGSFARWSSSSSPSAAPSYKTPRTRAVRSRHDDHSAQAQRLSLPELRRRTERDRLPRTRVRAFHAVPLRRYEDGEGRLVHAEVRVDDTVVMLGDSAPEWPAVRSHLHVYVPDVDAFLRRAVDAGGKAVQEPAQKGDSDKRGGVKDPAGNTWWIATQVG